MIIFSKVVPGAKRMIPTKLSVYRTNRFDVIQFLVNFSFSSAAILDFEKWRFWHFLCLGCVISKPHGKFCENRTNGSGVIQVLVNFKMAAGGHLGLWISTFYNHWLVSGAKWMIYTKLGAHRANRFEVIQFLVNFSFSSAAILDFEK